MEEWKKLVYIGVILIILAVAFAVLKKTISIVDRREAIRTACMMAQRGDVILVAGKGHEDYQIIKGVKYHFDDHEVVREAFGLTEN